MKNLYLGKTLFAILTAFVLVTTVSCTHVGPPSHAPAYGHRLHHNQYYYYPSVSVYYHIQTGYYFYYSSGAWLRVRVLPRHIHLGSHDRVRIRIKGGRPYAHYDQHRLRYKPNKKYKKLFRRGNDERSHNRRQHDAYGDQPERRKHHKERREKKGHKKERKERWR